MKFTKNISNSEVLFSLIEDEENNCINAEITIPAYGHWKRGAIYEIEVLNSVVMEKIKTKVTPTTKSGRVKALQDSTKVLSLNFKKDTPTRSTTTATSSTSASTSNTTKKKNRKTSNKK